LSSSATLGPFIPHFPDGFVNQCHEMKILL
jgi:hypothetical protein